MLVGIAGDSITSQNNGDGFGGTDSGDAQGVLSPFKRALNIIGASWVDLSIPGMGMGNFTSGRDLVGFRASLIGKCDRVIDANGHNDRPGSADFLNSATSLLGRHRAFNGAMRGLMKPDALLFRSTLLPQMQGQAITALSQAGTTATATVQSTAIYTDQQYLDIETGSGTTAGYTSDIAVSAMSLAGTTMTVTCASTTGMAAGDPVQIVGLTNTGSAWNTYDSSVQVQAVTDGTHFTYTAPAGVFVFTGTVICRAPRKITIISPTQFTWTNPAGPAGAAVIGSGGARANDRWKTFANQFGVNNDSIFVPDWATHPTLGHQFKHNDYVMRRGLYRDTPYGSTRYECDGGIDLFAAYGAVMTGPGAGKHPVDGTEHFSASDKTHIGKNAQARTALALAPMLAAIL